MLVIIFTLVTIIISIIIIIKSCFRPKNYPPGPPFLPLIGSWYAVPAHRTEQAVSKWSQKFGNVIGHKVFSRYIIFITGNKEIIDGLKHPNFQKRLHTETVQFRSYSKLLGLFFNEGDHWSEIRRFTLRYLGQMFHTPLERIMQEEMCHFFSTVRSGEITEVNRNFTDFGINYIMQLLCGINRGEYKLELETIKYLTDKSFRQAAVTRIDSFYSWTRHFFNFKIQVKTIRIMHRFLKDRLEEHRANFDGTIKDYMDAFLVQQEKEKQLMPTVTCYTDQQLFSCMSDLIQPATEGLENMVAFCLLYVALNPSVQNKMHEELDRVVGRDRFPQLKDKIRLPYCEAVMYETFRLKPVAPLGVAHTVSQDSEFYGYSIPKDSVIFFAHGDTGLYRKIFDDFELFKPERYLSKELKTNLTVFGIGKRACIGEILSKNSVFLFIAYFFQKYFISLPKGYEKPTTEAIPGLANSITPFKLVITERT